MILSMTGYGKAVVTYKEKENKRRGKVAKQQES